MAARPHHPLDPIAGAVECVPLLRFLEHLACAGRGEEVVLGRGHQPGLRREQLDVVGLIEARGEESGHALFGVADRSGKQRLERIHVAGDGRHFDPWIERGDVGGLGSAAGAPGRADASRIDLGPADQVVDRAHAVVDEIAGQRLAHQDRRGAVGEMLIGRAANQRAAGAHVVRLLPFSLADRVIGQHDESSPGEVDRQQLPRRLARIPMAHRHQDRGMAARPIRAIEVRGDHEAREAFERDVLDQVAVTARGLRHLRPQRTAIVGETADQRQDTLAHRSLSRLGGGTVLDRRDGRGARLQLPLRDRVELAQECRRFGRLGPERCGGGRRRHGDRQQGAPNPGESQSTASGDCQNCHRCQHCTPPSSRPLRDQSRNTFDRRSAGREYPVGALGRRCPDCTTDSADCRQSWPMVATSANRRSHCVCAPFADMSRRPDSVSRIRNN